jgi:hypothetical protein
MTVDLRLPVLTPSGLAAQELPAVPGPGSADKSGYVGRGAEALVRVAMTLSSERSES